jgi:protein TonB
MTLMSSSSESSSRRSARAELFARLPVTNPARVRRGVALPVSFVGHTVVLVLVVLLPILLPSPPPEHPDYIRALIYNPPPPPPPPLNKGTSLVEKAQPSKPVTPDPTPQKPTFTAPVETPKETPLKPEAKPPDSDQVGSETGSDLGIPEGMEEGVEGGVVGGVPGGVLGGVVGGTGDGPVLDYDQGPKLIKQTRPIYPQEAFIKKVEGIVEVEFLIDSSGRVVSARVIRSIPLLDAAALATVRQWVFAPAVKKGRPVATIARAPVTFRIY